MSFFPFCFIDIHPDFICVLFDISHYILNILVALIFFVLSIIRIFYLLEQVDVLIFP